MITKEMMYKKLQEVQDGRSAGTAMGIQKAKELVEYLSVELCPDEFRIVSEEYAEYIEMDWLKSGKYSPVGINVKCYVDSYVVTIGILFESYEQDLTFHTSMVRPVLSLIRSYVE